MELQQLKKNLEAIGQDQESVTEHVISSVGKINIYYKSIRRYNDDLFFMGRSGSEKYLYILSSGNNNEEENFEGNIFSSQSSGLALKVCTLSTHNRKALQRIFPFTNAVVVGLKNSFGFGDRIGLANAGHLQALNGSDFVPILAQQSIRELTRTNRSADEVMDAAVWAVFQEGFTRGFSADADHLKSTEDIKMMVKAGYRMITFDPGEFVEDNADIFQKEELLAKLKTYPWDKLNDSLEQAVLRYAEKRFVINGEVEINPDEISLLRAYCKYGRCLSHVKELYEFLNNEFADFETEVEISVDETDSVTSVFEHYFIANELRRLSVEFVSLAPRFIGSFEKGIDYKGDLKVFEQEYKKHAAIASSLGNYKISLHSGSDKFSVYKIIGKLKKGLVHVKTAGTSYLEALKVVALKQPVLFREILDFSMGLYENEKRTYHVSADLNKLKSAGQYSDKELLDLFNSDDARQILHVTFGKVLTEKDNSGKFLFKEKILECLKVNEEEHYQILVKHFRKHLEPFE